MLVVYLSSCQQLNVTYALYDSGNQLYWQMIKNVPPLEYPWHFYISVGGNSVSGSAINKIHSDLPQLFQWILPCLVG